MLRVKVKELSPIPSLKRPLAGTPTGSVVTPSPWERRPVLLSVSRPTWKTRSSSFIDSSWDLASAGATIWVVSSIWSKRHAVWAAGHQNLGVYREQNSPSVVLRSRQAEFHGCSGRESEWWKTPTKSHFQRCSTTEYQHTTKDTDFSTQERLDGRRRYFFLHNAYFREDTFRVSDTIIGIQNEVRTLILLSRILCYVARAVKHVCSTYANSVCLLFSWSRLVF